MKINRYRGSFMLCLVLLITLLASHFPLGSTPLLLEVTAERKEYEVEKFDENITILPINLQTINFYLEEGEQVEIIYALQVNENLPIDIWFMTEDNYLLFVNDAQFLYFIDGSEQQVTYTKKIVTLNKPGVYKLVMTNYNNQTVEVNIICELRTYYAESSETSSEDSSIFLYPLLFAVLILAALLIVLLFKTRKYNQSIPKVSDKASSKKSKTRKPKRAKSKVTDKAFSKKAKVRKPKQAKPKFSEKALSNKPETLELESEEPKSYEKLSPGFCGYCGKPVTTPYCLYCGRKV